MSSETPERIDRIVTALHLANEIIDAQAAELAEAATEVRALLYDQTVAAREHAKAWLRRQEAGQ